MASVPVKVGDRTVWMQEKKDMAEQLKVLGTGEHIVVGTQGEHVLLTLESKSATCEIRFTFAEAEQFEEAFDKMRKRVGHRVEARRAREGIKVHGVDDDDDDPGQGVAE